MSLVPVGVWPAVVAVAAAEMVKLSGLATAVTWSGAGTTPELPVVSSIPSPAYTFVKPGVSAGGDVFVLGLGAVTVVEVAVTVPWLTVVPYCAPLMPAIALTFAEPPGYGLQLLALYPFATLRPVLPADGAMVLP